jgi:hypothetical protein
MTDLTSFQRFPELLGELRNHIWNLVLKPRILQLGVNGEAPYPCLHKKPIPAERYIFRCTHLIPIRSILPTLFSACSESRQLCSYTYIHPYIDVPYISRLAARVLSCERGEFACSGLSATVLPRYV